MAAFARAFSDGAAGIEFDVRLASDGVPVVIHDEDLRRVGMRADRVCELTSSELATCDVGSWFNHRFPALALKAYANERVPTLKQLFSYMENSRGLSYLEMKIGEDDGFELAQAVSNLIQAHSLYERVIVLSFDPAAMRAVKEIDPVIRTGALFEPRVVQVGALIRRARIVRAALDCGADEIALHRLLVTTPLVQQASAAGLKVVVWTVDKTSWLGTARRLGVHALITNKPQQMSPRRVSGALDF